MTLNRNALLDALIGDQAGPSTADVNAILGTMPRREGTFLTEYHDNSIGPAPWISDLGNSLSRLSTNSLADVLMAPQGTPQAEQGMKNAIMDSFNVAGAAVGGGTAFPKPTNSLGIFGGKMPKGISAHGVTDGIGRTNYDIMRGRKRIGNAYIRDLGDVVQVGRVSIDEPYTRQGIGSSLYGQIERELGKPLVPDGVLSDAAYSFWKKHHPERLGDYERKYSMWSKIR